MVRIQDCCPRGGEPTPTDGAAIRAAPRIEVESAWCPDLRTPVAGRPGSERSLAAPQGSRHDIESVVLLKFRRRTGRPRSQPRQFSGIRYRRRTRPYADPPNPSCNPVHLELGPGSPAATSSAAPLGCARTRNQSGLEHHRHAIACDVRRRLDLDKPRRARRIRSTKHLLSPRFSRAYPSGQ